jgi:hypothetical protein
MLTQNRIGQGKIGFEFAKAGSIDQGRQRLLSRQCAVSSEQLAVGSELEVTANSLLHTAHSLLLFSPLFEFLNQKQIISVNPVSL